MAVLILILTLPASHMTLEQVHNGSLHNLMVLMWRCMKRHSLKVEYFKEERGAEKQHMQMDAMSQKGRVDNNLQLW